MKTITIFLLLFSTVVFAQQKGSFTDPRDGKTYKTVKIGVQTWMAENLNYPSGVGKCYDNKPDNCKKYGRLYYWQTAMEVCPSGWHLPSDDEWEILIDFAGGEENAGKKLKAKTGWSSNASDDLAFHAVQNANGSDNFGFSALPGGNGSSSGKFGYAGHHGAWWSSTVYNAQRAFYRFMHSDKNKVGTHAGTFDGMFSSLFSVRCVKDSPTFPSSMMPSGSYFTDSRDSKKYKAVKIGTQTWMAENLDYNASGSRCYDNNSANCNKYGRLYDWETAMRVCPKSWHLPSNAEWDKLYRFVDKNYKTDYSGKIGYSTTAGKHLKATSGWNWNNYDDISGNGEDSHGFSALPGGYGGYSSGGYIFIAGRYGVWWSASEDGSYNAYGWSMLYYDEYAYWNNHDKSDLFSVRCVQD